MHLNLSLCIQVSSLTMLTYLLFSLVERWEDDNCENKMTSSSFYILVNMWLCNWMYLINKMSYLCCHMIRWCAIMMSWTPPSHSYWVGLLSLIDSIIVVRILWINCLGAVYMCFVPACLQSKSESIVFLCKLKHLFSYSLWLCIFGLMPQYGFD